MTSETVAAEPESVKPPRRLIRQEHAQNRLGGISKPTMWRLEQQFPTLAAAVVYVGNRKTYIEDVFNEFFEEYIAAGRDPFADIRGDGNPIRRRGAAAPTTSWTTDDIAPAEEAAKPRRTRAQK